MLQLVLPFLAVVMVGVGVALETPTNAFLAKTSGSVLWASLFSFLAGTAMLAAALVVQRPVLAEGWRQAPWYAWIGGVYGALLVLASAWATPKLGAGTTLVVIVASQVALGVALDDYGLLGRETRSATPLRFAGIAVIVAGAAMIAKG